MCACVEGFALTSALCVVYAYVPETDQLCSQNSFMCNSDGFGTSMNRGAFTFLTGQ